MIQLDALLQLLELRCRVVEQRRRPSVVAQEGGAELGTQLCSYLYAFSVCRVGRFVSESLPGLFVLLLGLEGLDIVVAKIALAQLLVAAEQQQRDDPHFVQSPPSSERAGGVPAAQQDHDLAGGHHSLPVESNERLELVVLTGRSCGSDKAVRPHAGFEGIVDHQVGQIKAASPSCLQAGLERRPLPCLLTQHTTGISDHVSREFFGCALVHVLQPR